MFLISVIVIISTIMVLAPSKVSYILNVAPGAFKTKPEFAL